MIHPTKESLLQHQSWESETMNPFVLKSWGGGGEGRTENYCIMKNLQMSFLRAMRDVSSPSVRRTAATTSAPGCRSCKLPSLLHQPYLKYLALLLAIQTSVQPVGTK